MRWGSSSSDGRVDQSDIAEFGLHFFDGAYDFLNDFDHNETENIVDLTILADHIGETCP